MARVEFRTIAGGKTYGTGFFELADDAGSEVTKDQISKFSYKDALVKFDLRGVRDFVYVRRDTVSGSTLLICATRGSLHLELGIGPPHELFKVLTGTGGYAENKREKKRKKLNAELISDTHFSPGVPIAFTDQERSETADRPRPARRAAPAVDPIAFVEPEEEASAAEAPVEEASAAEAPVEEASAAEAPVESSPSSVPPPSGDPSSVPPPSGSDTRPVDVVHWPTLEHRFAAESPARVTVAGPIRVGVTTPVNLGFTDQPANVNMNVQTQGAIGVHMLGSSEPIALRLVIAEPIEAKSDYEIQLHLKGNVVLSVSVSGTTVFTQRKDG